MSLQGIRKGGRRLLEQTRDLGQVVGMLVTQHQLGGRPDLAGFVAVHDRDGVRPGPGVAVVVVFESADALRCPTKQRLINGLSCLTVGAGSIISGEGITPHRRVVW